METLEKQIWNETLQAIVTEMLCNMNKPCRISYLQSQHLFLKKENSNLFGILQTQSYQTNYKNNKLQVIFYDISYEIPCVIKICKEFKNYTSKQIDLIKSLMNGNMCFVRIFNVKLFLTAVINHHSSSSNHCQNDSGNMDLDECELNDYKLKSQKNNDNSGNNDSKNNKNNHAFNLNLFAEICLENIECIYIFSEKEQQMITHKKLESMNLNYVNSNPYFTNSLITPHKIYNQNYNFGNQNKNEQTKNQPRPKKRIFRKCKNDIKFWFYNHNAYYINFNKIKINEINSVTVTAYLSEPYEKCDQIKFSFVRFELCVCVCV